MTWQHLGEQRGRLIPHCTLKSLKSVSIHYKIWFFILKEWLPTSPAKLYSNQRCCCQASPSEQLLFFKAWAPLKETLNLHLNMCQSGVALLRFKYILLTYHHSAGYEQGYWDSLFVLEGNGSWGNEDMRQEAINYFSIILKSLCWQLLKINIYFYPSFPLYSTRQQAVCDRTWTL